MKIGNTRDIQFYYQRQGRAVWKYVRESSKLEMKV